ncbi:P2X purinoceptor 4b isoform X2 [Gadus macrocephalus]|uniref:P2X purinoceptor 4b isoform X2 n=1 Tax=Gadus macrocephalus TaxID=80720 RepID=UPI0028CB4FA1|nr:P2X purinoceptor 4b isoform X2 [Gadus macrocephalus]
MGAAKSSCQGFLHYAFDYETPKTLVVPSIAAGVVFRFTQLLILLYLVGYVCIVQKAYQDTDSVVSTVTTKVKGYAVIKGSANTSSPQFRDVADYVIPPQGDKSFFVVTNMIVTTNQKVSHCPEIPKPSTLCNQDSQCTTGLEDLRGNGVRTGRCVNYSDTVQTCQVLSWCPLEEDTGPNKEALIDAAENFTLLIKNSVTYPKFNFHRRNIMPHINSSYLKTCVFNSSTDPHCPIFRLKQIVSDAGEEFQVMAVEGGVLGILIDWTCDLDLWASQCLPKYSFRRLDDNNKSRVLAPGYNFRFAKYYKSPEGTESRTLIKAYGIRFEVIVFGTAGKFSMLPTLVNLGSTLTFLSLVPTVSDWFLLTFTKKRDFYSKHKTTHLRDEDEEDEDENKQSMSMGTSYGTQ